MNRKFLFPMQDTYGNKMCVSPINRVNENIFIGDENAASDLNILKNYGITHIINCAAEVKNYYEKEGISYLNLHLYDADDVLLPKAVKALEYIKDHPNNKILIHCHMGISRSASIVIYYLIKVHGHTYASALKTLILDRPIVKPNVYYENELIHLKK